MVNQHLIRHHFVHKTKKDRVGVNEYEAYKKSVEEIASKVNQHVVLEEKEGGMMAASKKPKSEDLEFQMVFYEGVLRQRPDFVDVLIALGEIYTKKGFYEKGLKSR